MSFDWPSIIMCSHKVFITLFIVIKYHFTLNMRILKKTHIKTIRQFCYCNILHWFINIIGYIINLFIDSKFWLWWIFHMFWVFIIAHDRLMHFICSTYFWHSIMFWVVFLVCCHKSLFALRNRYCIWLLLYFYLIILTDHH